MKIAMRMLVLSLLVFAGLLGCKKKKEAPQEVSPAQNPQLHFNPEKLNGYLYKRVSYFYNNDTLRLNDFSLQAGFFDDLIYKDSVLSKGIPVDVGNVYYNDSLTHKYTDSNIVYYNYYGSGVKIPSLSPNKWKITGKGDFGGFDYVDNLVEPTFSGTGNMIDTVWVGHENILKINGLKAASKIEVYIESVFNPNEISGPKTYSTSINEVRFANWETVPLLNDMPNRVFIVVQTYRDNFQVINGKILNFQSCIVFSVMVPAKY